MSAAGQKLKTLSAGIIPVFEKAGGFEVLLLRSYNYWDFPKGLVEPGEDPLTAAKRELQEETGIGDASFPWGEDFIETAPYGRGKVARYYLAAVKTQKVIMLPNPTTGVIEHHEYRWLPLTLAATLLVARLHPVLSWAERKLGG